MAETAAASRLGSVFDVGINETLPAGQLLLLGFQNIFGMIGMFVFPALFGRSFNMPVDQIAYVYGMTFMTAGITSCFQSVVLLRLPIMQGPYVGSFAAILALGHLPGGGLAVGFGSFFVACIVWAFLVLPIRRLSFAALFAQFMNTPLITGTMVLLAMFQIANVSLPNWINAPQSPGFPFINLMTGAVGIVAFIGVTVWGGRRWRRGAILAGLIIGTAAFAVFVPINFGRVVSAPWFVAPHPFPFGFAVRADLVVVFVLVLVPASIGSMPLMQMVAHWGGEKAPPTRMSEGLFAVSLGSMLAAALGVFSLQIYPDNIGMMRATRVASRYATLTAGILLVVLGSCVKFDMLLVLVPVPVLSAVATILFGIVMVHAIHILAHVEWDDRNLVVAGAALMIGLGGLFVTPETARLMPLAVQLILKQSAVTGGVTLLVLHALLNHGRAGHAAA